MSGVGDTVGGALGGVTSTVGGTVGKFLPSGTHHRLIMQRASARISRLRNVLHNVFQLSCQGHIIRVP